VLEKHPKYMENGILERIVEPERVISFRVPWVDDQGKVRVNRGFREGKSDGEVMRFTQSFMTELYNYIGPDTDVPAGDIGVGAREVGYLFGQYKKIAGGNQPGVLTGKGLEYGGSLAELGAKVVACSDSNGFIYDENGIDLDTVKELKEVKRERIREYVTKHPNAAYYEGWEGIWSIPCDIALPCATQNEISKESAQKLIANGVKAVGEGANMPSTLEAIDLFLDS